MTGRIHSVQSLGTLDGPGVRFVVFLQGCPLRCGCCHNPDTWDTSGGEAMSADALTQKALRYREYFGNDGGITLSGGEPFLQPEACAELADEAHKRGLNVWCYTGYTIDTIIGGRDNGKRGLLKRIDVLVDGPYIESLRTLELPWRGSKNQRVIELRPEQPKEVQP